MSKSQLGQDIRVLDFYKNKKGGCFVDIGASDGIKLSNTYLLEKEFQWKGICVEPVPETFQKLIVNRPESICCQCSVYSESDLTLLFDVANDDDLYSGISQHIDCHKSVVDSNKRTIQTQTISLLDLLVKNDAPSFIEYLSLDTEGSEYEILKGFKFDNYIFGLIDVEHNFVEPRRTHIRDLLTSNGYVYMGENRWDDMYKHSSL